MRKYKCPDCGRHLCESDAPAGYVIRVPSCRQCRTGKVLHTGVEPERNEAKPKPTVWPDPLKYR